MFYNKGQGRKFALNLYKCVLGWTDGRTDGLMDITRVVRFVWRYNEPNTRRSFAYRPHCFDGYTKTMLAKIE